MQGHDFVIVADENIPFVRDSFGSYGEVRTLNGRDVTADCVRDADVLLVRSVTPVHAGLLEGSRVRFVGSTTIGTDHIDQDYLRERGIAFAHAPGSNATSVVEYVLAALLRTAVRRGESLKGKTFGIVGVGNIGSRLAARLPALGMQLLTNDPPRADTGEMDGGAGGYVPLDLLLAESDVVTLHVPLEKQGPYPTFHLIGREALERMKPGAWLLNTCRGPVVDNAVLRGRLEAGRLGAAVLDVWEGEPTPDLELLRLVDVATPHIAGYSFDGKVNGTVMVYEAFLKHFRLESAWHPEVVLDGTGADQLALTPPDEGSETRWLHALVRQMYDIGADDARMRSLLDLPPDEQAAYFTACRKHYPRRRTFSRFELNASAVPPGLLTAVRDGLCVRLT
ncbi:MAG TPA: 4-phosphoerythronate dehydrogenase [Rhodothermales bacterium]|nr:4-phosphoerythronate dehydrogenase [Rhodothermales bacterium]